MAMKLGLIINEIVTTLLKAAKMVSFDQKMEFNLSSSCSARNKVSGRTGTSKCQNISISTAYLESKIQFSIKSQHFCNMRTLGHVRLSERGQACIQRSVLVSAMYFLF